MLLLPSLRFGTNLVQGLILLQLIIYTYEVVENINETYPIPAIILVLIVAVIGVFLFYKRKGVLKQTFKNKRSFLTRTAFVPPVFVILLVFVLFVKNKSAEWSENIYENELSKNGVYSFFAAFRSNELDYKTFYATIPDNEAYQILKNELLQSKQKYETDRTADIKRIVSGCNK